MKTFTELLAKEGPIIGTWSQIASPDVVEIMGHSGFDFTIIDMEHTSFGFETAEMLVRACDAVGMAPLVRLPRNDRADITRALDIGAAGIVVPGIGSVAEAKAAIEATRFEPVGTRGACPFIRAGHHFVRDWDAYSRRAEAETGAIILVEEQGVVSELEAIASLPGLTCLFIGPFDLSVSLGFKGDTLHPEVLSTIEQMVEVGLRAGVPVMMPLFVPDLAEASKQMERWLESGVRLFTVGGDKILLSDYCTRYIASLTSTSGAL